jgi:hypothetical protein
VRARIVALIVAACAVLAGGWLLLSREAPPMRLNARLLQVRRSDITRLDPLPIQDVVRAMVRFEISSAPCFTDEVLFHGELRIGEVDPDHLYMAGAWSKSDASGRFEGELSMDLDGEQNGGVTQAVFVDILRSDAPLAVRVRAWDGSSVLAESDWLDFAAFRQELTSLLQ